MITVIMVIGMITMLLGRWHAVVGTGRDREHQMPTIDPHEVSIMMNIDRDQGRA